MGITVNDHESLLLEVRHEIHPAGTIMIEAGVGCIRLINAVVTEGVHGAVDNILSGDLSAVNDVVGIVQPAVGSHNAVNIGLAIGEVTAEDLAAAVGALQNAINNLVFMAGRRNGGAPYKDRAAAGGGVTIVPLFILGYAGTAGTEYAADITIFGTGSSLVLCFACGMEVPAALIVLQEVFLLLSRSQFAPPATDLTLGIHLDLITGEHLGSTIRILDLTGQRVDDDVIVMTNKFLPAFIGVIHAIAIEVAVATGRRNISGVFLFLKLPGLNRNGNNRLFSGCFYFAGACDGDIRKILACDISGIRSCKAIQRFHVLEHPLVHIVQIQRQGNALNIFHVLSHHVNPILRTGRHQSRIGLRRNPDVRVIVCSLYIDLPNDGGIVARLVANCELNGMHTILQLSRINGHGLAVKFTADFVAIDIRLSGSTIKTGCIYESSIFRDINAETNALVICNRCSIALIVQILVFSRDRLNIFHLSKNRSFSVFTSLRIIDSHIVNKEGIDTRNTRSSLPVVFATGTTAQLTRNLNSRTSSCSRIIDIKRLILAQGNTVILANINGTIYPTRLLEIQSVSIIDGVAVDSDCFTVLYAGKAEPNSCAYRILGDIHPHANPLRVFVGDSFTGPTHCYADPVQGRIGGIRVNRTRRGAVVNHTVFSGCCICFVNIVIEARLGMRSILSLLKMLYIPTIAKAIFKVPNHFGCLTKDNIHRSSHFGVMDKRRKNSSAGYSQIFCCSQLVAIQCTHVVVREGYGKVRSLTDYIINIVCS